MRIKIKNQKGFAHVEAALLVVVVAIIAATLWYVWHSNSQANKQYDNLSNPTLSTKKKATPKTSKAAPKPAPAVVNYTTASNTDGVSLQNDSDLDKLDGASDKLKDFLKDKLDKNKTSPSPCGNAYGLFVKKIYQDKFAFGGESHCKHTDKLWAKVSEQWTEIGSTGENFDCTILDQYKVPASIVEHCMKNGQLVNNAQTDQ